MCPQVRSTRLGYKTSSFSRPRCLRQGLHCTQEGPQSLHVVCSPRAKQVSIFCRTLFWGFYGKIETFGKRLGVNGQRKIETAIKKLKSFWLCLKRILKLAFFLKAYSRLLPHYRESHVLFSFAAGEKFSCSSTQREHKQLFYGVRSTRIPYFFFKRQIRGFFHFWSI